MKYEEWVVMAAAYTYRQCFGGFGRFFHQLFTATFCANLCTKIFDVLTGVIFAANDITEIRIASNLVPITYTHSFQPKMLAYLIP